MGYDWEGEADKIAEKVPAGIHRLRVNKIVTAGKGGTFKSRAGDPQVMVVFTNDRGAEVAQMFTLSTKAAWTMAKLLSRCGVDLKALKDGGIEPKHFANQKIAEQYLVGCETWARVEYEASEDGKSYSRVEPMTALEAGHGESEAAPPKAPEPSPARPRSTTAASVAADPFAGGGPGDEDIPF